MSQDPKPKTSRLGRGLSSLIGEVEAESTPETQSEKRPNSDVAINDIRPNPAQPRRTFIEEDLQDLADSIRAKGVLQAILVRPDPDAANKYQIVAGERRWRAAKIAGLKAIPVIVKDLDELELLEVGIIENVQRSDLNPIEEAEAYGALLKRFGRTQESLAGTIGKSRAHISNTLRLLNLSPTSRDHLRSGRITAGHARAALGAASPDRLVELAVAKGLTVRDVEAMARRSKAGDDLEGGDKTRRASEPKDVDTQALEADLSRSLGLGIDIRPKGSAGEIRIKYATLEQLDDLCRKLSAQRSN